MFVLITSGFSQTDFRPGFYITWNNDTVYGLVDYRGENRNSSFCIFKENQESEPIQFEPSEIQAYRFVDSKYFVSKKINTTEGEKQVFVEFLVNGIKDLFYYDNAYFIEGENGVLIKLKDEIKDEYIEGKGTFRHETFEYIGVLKAIFADCKEIQSQIDKAKLEHKSLINLTKKYHNYVCDDEKCIIYEKQLPLLKFYIAPQIGGEASSLQFDSGLFSKFDFVQTYYPSLGFVISTSLPKISEKLSLDIGIDIGKSDYYGYYKNELDFAIEYNDAHINLVSLQPSGALKYTFPKGKIRPTFALGLLSNFFISKDLRVIREIEYKNTVVTSEITDIQVASNFIGGFVQLGCNYQILDKHNAFTNLRLGQSFNRTEDQKTILQTFSISFGMFLN